MDSIVVSYLALTPAGQDAACMAVAGLGLEPNLVPIHSEFEIFTGNTGEQLVNVEVHRHRDGRKYVDVRGNVATEEIDIPIDDSNRWALIFLRALAL